FGYFNASPCPQHRDIRLSHLQFNIQLCTILIHPRSIELGGCGINVTADAPTRKEWQGHRGFERSALILCKRYLLQWYWRKTRHGWQADFERRLVIQHGIFALDREAWQKGSLGSIKAVLG